ncbi:MAG: hypothetical protein ACLF0G_07720 [Candidatus Brocadiia bacterium]
MPAVVACLFVAVLGLSGCGPAGHARRGDRHLARGEHVAAIWEYGEALERREDPDVALRRACALSIMGDGQGARSHLARAARAGSIQARALLAAQRGIHDLAAAEALVARHPRKSWAWAYYGDSLLAAARPADAAGAYQRALHEGLQGPLGHAVRYNLALALLCAGDRQAAARSYKAYCLARDHPPGPQGRFLGGLLAYARGDHAAAMAHWRSLPQPLRARVRQIVGDEPAFAEL